VGDAYLAFYSPHELKKLLKRYGVEVEELGDIERVEFYSGKKKIVVSNPQVIAFKMTGQIFYQVVGTEVREENIEEERLEATQERVGISEEDVNFIVEYTGAPREKAVEALAKAKGDLAKAIMILRGEEKT